MASEKLEGCWRRDLLGMIITTTLMFVGTRWDSRKELATRNIMPVSLETLPLLCLKGESLLMGY